MAQGMSYQNLSHVFGGDWTRYSLITNWFAKFIFHKYYHRLRGRSFEYWIDRENVQDYRNAIYDYVVLDKDGNYHEGCEGIDRNVCRIIGYIDCMMLQTCTPGSGPIDQDGNRNEDFYETQRAFFTNYGHMWGMKLQGVILPNGMLASIFTCSIAQNDKGVVNICGLNEELTRVLQPFPILGQVLASLYGDEIYEPAECICRRDNDNEALKYFYKRLNKGRINISIVSVLIAPYGSV